MLWVWEGVVKPWAEVIRAQAFRGAKGLWAARAQLGTSASTSPLVHIYHSSPHIGLHTLKCCTKSRPRRWGGGLCLMAALAWGCTVARLDYQTVNSEYGFLQTNAEEKRSTVFTSIGSNNTELIHWMLLLDDAFLRL